MKMQLTAAGENDVFPFLLLRNIVHVHRTLNEFPVELLQPLLHLPFLPGANQNQHLYHAIRASTYK